MTNTDLRFLRAHTRIIERMLTLLVSITDEAIDTYSDTTAEKPLRKLHSKIGAIRACADFDELRSAGKPS